MLKSELLPMCSSVCQCYIESSLSARRVERRSSKKQSIYPAKMCLCEKLIDGFFNLWLILLLLQSNNAFFWQGTPSTVWLTVFYSWVLSENWERWQKHQRSITQTLKWRVLLHHVGDRGKISRTQSNTMTGNVGLIVEFTGIHLLEYFSLHYLCTHYSHSGLLQISDAQYNFQCDFCGVIRDVLQLWTTVHFTSLSKYSVICKVTAHFIFSFFFTGCCADWALIPRQSQHSLLSQTHQWWDTKLMIYIFIRVYTPHQTEEEGELFGRVFA